MRRDYQSMRPGLVPDVRLLQPRRPIAPAVKILRGCCYCMGLGSRLGAGIAIFVKRNGTKLNLLICGLCVAATELDFIVPCCSIMSPGHNTCTEDQRAAA